MCFQFIYTLLSVVVVALVIVLGVSLWSRYGPPAEVKHFEESGPAEDSQTKSMK